MFRPNSRQSSLSSDEDTDEADLVDGEYDQSQVRSKKNLGGSRWSREEVSYTFVYLKETKNEGTFLFKNE